MILKSEEQRGLLLKIVSNTNINGTFTQAVEAVRVVNELVEDIENADVENSIGENEFLPGGETYGVTKKLL